MGHYQGSATYSVGLFAKHAKLLSDSVIPPDFAQLRGYVSVDTKKRLEGIHITPAGRNVPGLLIPLLRKDGSTWGYHYRPDEPRLNGAGKSVRYEAPTGQRNGLDVPPGVGPLLDDPAVPLWVTEGTRKADAATVAGLACVALPGVWNWRGSNDRGGKVAIADWHDVALNDRRVVLAFDSDVMVKPSVRSALVELARYLTTKGAHVEFLHLPDDGDGKTGLDDYLGDGHGMDDLWALVRPEPPAVADTPNEVQNHPLPEPVRRPDPAPVALADALATFQGWLHLPDTDPLLAVAAAAVANRTADASPVWLLVIGPPSAGKTEQIVGLAGLPEAVLAATVTESALLSGTSQKERAADATGGLLRQVGGHGLIVMKDFTSVLSQNRDARSQALSALREVYDGSWHRPVGTDGGKVLTWAGKVGVVAGCTNAYDRHYNVISQLGDRFLILRLASDDGDPHAAALDIGMSALTHSEDEQVERRMRRDLAAALTGLIAGAERARTHRPLTHDEKVEIVRLARYAGVSRTPVDRDGYTGDLLSMPAPEGPGRLTITFRQILGGLEAIGVDTDGCWRIIRRLAVDTAPALRTTVLRVLVDVHGQARTSDIATSAGLVTKTASRVLDDLSLIGLATHSKAGPAGNAADLWGPSELLTGLWPESKTEMYVPPNTLTSSVPLSGDLPMREQREGETSLSHSDELDEPPPQWDYS